MVQHITGPRDTLGKKAGGDVPKKTANREKKDPDAMQGGRVSGRKKKHRYREKGGEFERWNNAPSRGEGGLS